MTIRWQGKCFWCQLSMRIKTPFRVARNIVGPRGISLTYSLQPRNPSPRQCVGRRVPIQQMVVEERRAQLPGQVQGKNPTASKPHPSMIMKPAKLLQFRNPEIETVYASLPLHRAVILLQQCAARRQFTTQAFKISKVRSPNGWSVFQPPLPIGPPDNFLNKFFRLVKAVPLQDSSCHMLFRQGAMADPGREPGNIRPVRRTEIIVPL